MDEQVKSLLCDSLEDAKDKIVALEVKYSNVQSDDKAYKWLYTKPGGRKELVAMYEYSNNTLTIFATNSWQTDDTYQHANATIIKSRKGSRFTIGHDFTKSQYEAQYSTEVRNKYNDLDSNSNYGSLDGIYNAMHKEDSDWFGNG